MFALFPVGGEPCVRPCVLSQTVRYAQFRRAKTSFAPYHSMSDDPRILQLLEEALDSNRSPEEVCAEYPELLAAVRERYEQCRSVEAQLEAIFPPSGSNGPAERRRSNSAAGELPRIPGYEIESVLGRGGVGVVYKARQLNLNRPVALKMLLSGAYASAVELTRFMREAEAVARLQHAHIVQVHDTGDLDGRPYFTMELVEGGNLGQKLAGTPQPASQAAQMLMTLASAVHVAHRTGVVHRDLKPANILLTPDGTPKITDFGLAHHVGGDQALTISGARVGTPSYMAPEQATGKPSAIGPAADIYALGAILYEMLTGRPPFRGETASETERQLISQDPVSPSRLNAKVPRDLETICLKCLRKDPEKRYVTAAALAEDLDRYLNGYPIAARPMGLAQRSLRWIVRRPALAAALAGTLLLACVVIAGGVWMLLQNSERRSAVEADLKQVTQFQEQARWTAARAALEKAEARLGDGGPVFLRRRFGQARQDLDLVIRLDAIRLTRVTQGEPAIYKARANRNYEETFQDAGLYARHDAPEEVAARIKESAVREALTAALDDWMICTADKDQRRRLIEAARWADADPKGWRARILDQATWDDPAALSALARDVPIDGPSLSLLLALGERLKDSGEDSSAFLKRVQREHPADFWANLTLGNALLFRSPMEAGGYYRAALASRPDAAVGYCAVGDALRLQTANDAAMHYYKKALLQDPNYARAYTNLGLTLQNKGVLDEAIENYRKAIPLDPDYSWSYFELANALRAKGLFDEAGENYEKAAQLDPTNGRARDGVRGALMRHGHGEQVWADWKKALEANPRDVDDWIGYAQLSLFLGRKDEYLRARRELLDRFGASESPFITERTSRACLLLPADGDDLQIAVALADRAIALKDSTNPWVYQYFLFAKGLADYQQGRFDAAITLMQGGASKVMGPSPRLVVAMAQHRQGKSEAARKSLAAAVLSFDWSASGADSRDVWIWHILRREAEEMILPDLPAFLSGNYWPQENIERLALIGVCQFKGLHASAARLYADAFAAAPDLAEDLAAAHRFNAARSAALAGCDHGEQTPTLSDVERSRWRAQAREWLRADLAAWIKESEGGEPVNHAKLQQRLTRMQHDKDLAGIRDANALAELPPEERAECLALWREVGSYLDRSKVAKL
ncbi:MAG: tetratricopeptide repeat protein [Phycisphaerales bacterium]|nr:tetratricopeptide repeat protein [Phycisphaerales bacterium]